MDRSVADLPEAVDLVVEHVQVHLVEVDQLLQEVARNSGVKLVPFFFRFSAGSRIFQLQGREPADAGTLHDEVLVRLRGLELDDGVEVHEAWPAVTAEGHPVFVVKIWTKHQESNEFQESWKDLKKL